MPASFHLVTATLGPIAKKNDTTFKHEGQPRAAAAKGKFGGWWGGTSSLSPLSPPEVY